MPTIHYEGRNLYSHVVRLGLVQHGIMGLKWACAVNLVRDPGLQIRVCIGKLFSLFLTHLAYVVGTQKNRLNETVLLITQNTCLIIG